MDLCDIGSVSSLLSSFGFRFSKSLGQNFLIDPEVPENIVAAARIDGNTGVLEIGPGIGCLTRLLSRDAAKVVSVELDGKLIPVLEKTLAGCDNIEIIHGDILRLDIAAIVAEKFSGLHPAVCANLPYSITTPLLSAIIDSRCFDRVTVMVQREVARRICAKPGSSDGSAFGVYVNYHAKPEILFDVPPESFIPRPAVYSTVMSLVMLDEPPARPKDEKLFFDVVKAAFSQRRKTLQNCLFSAYGTQLTKQDIVSVLENSGISEKARGETLDVPAFARLSDTLGERLGK